MVSKWAVHSTLAQVGMGLGVSARYVRTLSDKMTGRIVARASIGGVELEIGTNRRISQFSTAGMSISVGVPMVCALEAPKPLESAVSITP